MSETSSATELLVLLQRDRPRALAAQLEAHFRRAIRDGSLKPRMPLPSSRDLARQLEVSRGVVVNAYEQLVAEGYLVVRQGARPRVADAAAQGVVAAAWVAPAALPRYDFRLGVPDVSLFPRTAWLRSVRAALEQMTDDDLLYGDERGTERLRGALAAYLGRVRGVLAEPQRIVITSGYLQGQGLVTRALVAAGARRIAFENPCDTEPRISAARAGLEVVPIGVDAAGLRVDELERVAVDAVVLTPAHQFPTGVVLAPERRRHLVAWLRRSDAIAIEDDYDAEYRYDRAPVGSLQGLDPEHVVYAGSTSKTLAPALRIGWLVVPGRLVDAVAQEKLLADRGTARIEQVALAHFLEHGELDRHLRRMRGRYRRQRDVLVAAVAEAIPDATVEGIAAGLHAAVRLPEGSNEAAVLAEAHRRDIAARSLSQFAFAPHRMPPTLVLGYSRSSETAIRSGITALAQAIQAVGAS